MRPDANFKSSLPPAVHVRGQPAARCGILSVCCRYLGAARRVCLTSDGDARVLHFVASVVCPTVQGRFAFQEEEGAGGGDVRPLPRHGVPIGTARYDAC